MIGGEYYINLKPVDDSLLYSLTSICRGNAFYSSGRDAIFSILTSLPAQRIWLPDFISKAAVDVVVQADKEIHFYPIGENLLPEEAWIATVQSGDIVFVSHLFGVTPHALLNQLALLDAVVISDLSQSIFHLSGWQAIAAKSTFIVSSLRNTMAVPDGAYAGSQKLDLIAPREPASDEFWVPRAAALLSKGGSAFQGFMSKENEALFEKAERWLDINPAASRKISDCSRAILCTISEQEWEERRKQTHHNQAILATHLSDKVACPQVKPTRTLPEISVSTFFAILLDPVKRNKIQAVLNEQRIRCPHLWDTSFLSTEHTLSKKILSIPCDARYNNRDMKYIASIIAAEL